LGGEKDTETTPVYLFGPFRLEVAERRLYREGTLVALPRKAFDLLLLLVEPAGHLRTREELIQALWPRAFVEEQNLTAKVHALRKALGDEGKVPQYIETVRGVGYRFLPDVTVEAEAAEAPRAHRLAAPKRNARRLRAALALVAVLLGGAAAWRFLGPGGGWPFATSPAAGAEPAIAVLPFQNLGPDKSAAYFAGGIQDTILTRLAGIGNFRIISSNSTARYRSHPHDVRRVARELGASDLVEGSVQKAGKRVMVNVRLIDGRTGKRLWADSYTRTLDNVFEVEGDVARSVADALNARLRPAEAARLARPATRDPKAYVDFLKANYYADRALKNASAADPLAATRKAIALYKSAVARDPGFALAYARLSLLESAAYWFEIDDDPRLIAASEHDASKAASLDPRLPEAHMALGYAAYYGHLDYATALRQFARAERIRPDDPKVIVASAYIHRRQGKWQRALRELRRAARLDPANPRWHNEIGITYMALRRYGSAEDQFREALAITPDNYDVMNRRLSVLILTGRFGALNRALRKIPRDVDPQGLFSSLRFEAAWLENRPARALAALSDAPTWVVSQDALGMVPKLLLEGEAQESRGNAARARTCYRGAGKMLDKAVQNNPGNADLWSALGVAEAALGETRRAISAGKRAIQLIPVSADALAGPAYLVSMARIYLMLGDKGPALKLLGRVLGMPAGRVMSAVLLRRDPTWNPLHGDPRYRSLLHSYERTRKAVPAASAARESTPGHG